MDKSALRGSTFASKKARRAPHATKDNRYKPTCVQRRHLQSPSPLPTSFSMPANGHAKPCRLPKSCFGEMMEEFNKRWPSRAPPPSVIPLPPILNLPIELLLMVSFIAQVRSYFNFLHAVLKPLGHKRGKCFRQLLQIRQKLRRLGCRSRNLETGSRLSRSQC